MIDSIAKPQAPPALVGTDALFVTDDDLLLVTSFNAAAGVALTIGGRILRRDGVVVPFTDRHVPNTDRTAATTVITLTAGWLQNLTVIATGTLVLGQAFVRVDLMRGRSNGARTPLATLLQGPVTAQQRAAWPGSPLLSSQAAPPALRVVAGSNPAAGAEVSETVPTGARWEVVAISFALVTDATVANREVTLVIDDGATILFTSASGFNHAASLTRRYSAAAIGAPTAPATATDRQIVIPSLELLAGHRIRTITTNLQAGDDYGAPQLLVRERLEAA